MKQLVRILSDNSLKNTHTHTYKLSPFIHIMINIHLHIEISMYILIILYTTQIHPQCLATLANASGVVCSRLTRVNLGWTARMRLRVYERWGKW